MYFNHSNAHCIKYIVYIGMIKNIVSAGFHKISENQCTLISRLALAIRLPSSLLAVIRSRHLGFASYWLVVGRGNTPILSCCTAFQGPTLQSWWLASDIVVYGAKEITNDQRF
jgi:hypothetical protein